MPELDVYSAELVKKVAEHCGWRAEVLGEGVVRLMGERRTRRGRAGFQWREDLLALLLGLLRCVCERERERVRVRERERESRCGGCLHQEEHGERDAEGARSYKDCGGSSKG
jgi:hypothetical protein